MTISLTLELEKIVHKKVAEGKYHSANDVIRDALQLLNKRDEIQKIQLSELRGEIKKGLDSGTPTALDMEEVIERNQKRWASKKENA